MPARSLPAQGRAVSEPRSDLTKSPGRSPATATAGVPFLLVTSLWASKEK